jgi:hypothetical protein
MRADLRTTRAKRLLSNEEIYAGDGVIDSFRYALARARACVRAIVPAIVFQYTQSSQNEQVYAICAAVARDLIRHQLGILRPTLTYGGLFNFLLTFLFHQKDRPCKRTRECFLSVGCWRRRVCRHDRRSLLYTDHSLRRSVETVART